jgi:hypothetical protein
MMNGIIEEGVAAMSTYATPGLVTFNMPVKVGLITAITTDEFKDNRHNWKKKGFLSRTIPFSYSYGMSTVNKVFESILKLDYMKEQEMKLNAIHSFVEDFVVWNRENSKFTRRTGPFLGWSLRFWRLSWNRPLPLL